MKRMKLQNVKFKFTGGVNGGQGWLDDVKFMHLSKRSFTKLVGSPNTTANKQYNLLQKPRARAHS